MDLPRQRHRLWMLALLGCTDEFDEMFPFENTVSRSQKLTVKTIQKISFLGSFVHFVLVQPGDHPSFSVPQVEHLRQLGVAPSLGQPFSDIASGIQTLI